MSKKLKPGQPSDIKMRQLMIGKNTVDDKPEWPFDFIYYNYYPTDGGFIVYQEMYGENKEKKLQKMFIPREMVEDLISLTAGERLLED